MGDVKIKLILVMKSSELKLSKIKLISDLVIFSFKFLNGKSQFKFEM